MLARRKELLESLAGEIAADGGQARPWQIDLGDGEAATKAARELEAEVGVPDVLVNCAGAGAGYFIEEMPPEEFERNMAVPFFAAANITRAFLPGMLERRERIHRQRGLTDRVCDLARGRRLRLRALGHARPLRGAQPGAARNRSPRRAGVVPGHVDSPYFDANPRLRESIPGIASLAGKVTPERVANAIIDAVERERGEVFVPFMMGVLVFQVRLFPGLTKYLVAELARGERRRPKRGVQRHDSGVAALGTGNGLPTRRSSSAPAPSRTWLP